VAAGETPPELPDTDVPTDYESVPDAQPPYDDGDLEPHEDIPVTCIFNSI